MEGIWDRYEERERARVRVRIRLVGFLFSTNLQSSISL
jgi:hypothetical protein